MANVVTIDNFGLQSGTPRTLYATWSWSREHTKGYSVRWYYTTGDSDGYGFLGKEEDTTRPESLYTAPDNATKVTVTVLPLSETYTVDGTDFYYFTGDWSAGKSFYFSTDAPPEKPPTPSVSIKDHKLTASLDNLTQVEAAKRTYWIFFEVVKNNSTVFVSEGRAKILTGHAQYSCMVDPGAEYKVRAKAVRMRIQSRQSGLPTKENPNQILAKPPVIEEEVIDDNGVSEWSEYSSNVSPEPAGTIEIVRCMAKTTTSVWLQWTKPKGAKTYDLKYSTDWSHLDNSDDFSTISGIEDDGSMFFQSYEKTGLTTGSEYFFKVRATNDQGSSKWSEVKSVVLGKTPAAPTTWSSSTTYMVGDDMVLNWTHNAEDGSLQTLAQIEVQANGESNTYEINTTYDPDDQKRMTYSLTTTSYAEGTKVLWKVRTAGVTRDYGPWSIQRSIDIYAPPSLGLAVTDPTGASIQTLTSFPINISGTAGPATQTPVGYYLRIVSNQAYSTTDSLGNAKVVNTGDAVYSKYFDTSNALSLALSASDLTLENNMNYTVYCTVTMDSGLTADASATFTVGWTASSYTPNAEIGINKDAVSAHIRPYCKDSNGNLVTGVTLGVYRREFDGTFTEIMSGLKNEDGTFVTDPHPALNYASYRIVATTTSSGAVAYYDIPLFPVGEKAIIIQWNEEWRFFNVAKANAYQQPTWSGSLLRLPYNVDVSNSYSMDTSLVEYIGRKHPISYYGTQLGETATWNVAIPKTDTETLYALRRLAIWTGDAYVREPSGSGYWANVGVAFSQKHRDMTIPVTLTIKRVSGGI